MSDKAATKGVHHVGLTVPDVEETGTFFVESLGFRRVGGKPDYPAVFVSDGTTMITLWQVADPARAVAFDRKNVIGLHHLALRIENADVLEALHGTLARTPDIGIEFAPEALGKGPTRHMMISIPGGIRLELIAPV